MDKRVCREQIEKLLSPYMPSHSRVHCLRSFGKTPLYIKRDDELSFSISGSKMRKYCSLLPSLIDKGVKRVCLIGGAYSNNILGLSQLLIENGMTPVAYLRKPGAASPQGNYLFIKMVIPEKNIFLIEREKWPFVEEIVREREEGKETFIVPEGAFIEEALAGALTLPLDIAENEKQLGIKFSHLLLDSGSGLQAIATILAQELFLPGAKISVLLLAGSKEAFIEKLKRFTPPFCRIMGLSQPDEVLQRATNYDLHTPSKGASFGSTTNAGFLQIVDIARREGLFADPIYSGKLLFEAQRIIALHPTDGNRLLIHSGGALSLSGFQRQLLSAVEILNKASAYGYPSPE